MRHSRASAALVAIGALAALPAGAQAATKTVFMGTPPSASGGLQKLGVESENFFPLKTTVRVGDKVSFAVVGFHTLELPAKGARPTPLVTPTGKTATDVKDEAGAAFWFNGLPLLGFTPSLLRSGFGKTFTVPSAKGVNSGLPLADRPKPITVRFAKAGSYTFFCAVHSGMKTTVRVVGKTGVVPSAKADAATLKRQVAATFATAKILPTTKPPANTVSLGAEKRGAVFFGFLPATLSVAPGTTVSFKMPVGSREVHTVSFGPGNPEKQPGSYLGKLAKSFESPAFAPAANYPSDKPGAPVSISPTLHGNGFWNSGLLDQVPASPPASSSAVRFDTPGTYDYYCLIHPFMRGKVKVG